MEKVGGLENEKEHLVDSIVNMANIIEESSATTEEVASLTITQNSVVNLMDKMTMDLNAEVESIRKQFEKIKILRTQKQKKRIAMIFDMDIPFYKVTEVEARKTAKILDFDLEVFAPKSRKTSIEEMSRDLEKIIKEEYHGIIISPISDPKIESLLKQATSKGIKLIFLNSVLSGIPYESLITSDGFNLGATAAKTAQKVMKQKGTALVGVWSDVHISAIEQREEGFLKEMATMDLSAKKIPIPCSPSETEADAIISKMLQDNPDTAVIYATNADWGCLFGKYFNKHKQDITVITIDYVKEMTDLIKKGCIDYAIAQRNFVWGSLSLEGLADTFAGKSMKKYNDTGSYEVTKNNISIYENRI
jgi:ABC-type sugar transport system, periplasmic component